MKFEEYDKLDDSIDSFRLLKARSEEYWSTISLDLCWGYQVQPGSKWKKGLTEQELVAFQNEMKLEFPEAMKNYFRVMNGLDKLGVSMSDNDSGLGYGPVFYSYPADIKLLKSATYWVLKDNGVSQEDYESGVVSKIFPYLGHRFLILSPEEIVLSMHGTDIILWADNLSKGIASDAIGFGVRLNKNIESIPSSFWINKTQ